MKLNAPYTAGAASGDEAIETNCDQPSSPFAHVHPRSCAFASVWNLGDSPTWVFEIWV